MCCIKITSSRLTFCFTIVLHELEILHWPFGHYCLELGDLGLFDYHCIPGKLPIMMVAMGMTLLTRLYGLPVCSQAAVHNHTMESLCLYVCSLGVPTSTENYHSGRR